MERPCVMFRPTNTGVDEMGMAALKVLSFSVLVWSGIQLNYLNPGDKILKGQNGI